LAAVSAVTSRALPSFDFDAAIVAIYDFAWHEVADWYLELTKARLEAGEGAALWVTRTVLLQTATLLHPIMPFLTDALAEQFAGIPASLDLTPWPKVEEGWKDPAAELSMAASMAFISDLRKWLQELGIQVTRHADRVPLSALESGPELAFPESFRYASAVVPVEWTDPSGDSGAEAAPQVVIGRTRLSVGRSVGASQQWRESVARELGKSEAFRATLERKLASPFTDQAPRDVVERERSRLAEVQQREALLRGLIDS
jgi:valyl-tRNA synthetase